MSMSKPHKVPVLICYKLVLPKVLLLFCFVKQCPAEQPWLARYFGVQHGLSLSSARIAGAHTPSFVLPDSKFLLTRLGIWLGGIAPTSQALRLVSRISHAYTETS